MSMARLIIVAFALVSLGATASGRASEPCPATAGVDQPGYLVDILLCTVHAPRCRPHGMQVYKAGRGASPEVQPLPLANIPDGYVITGGELFSSTYEMATLGFRDVSITSHSDAADYCSRHSLYDMRAEWAGSDMSDHMTIQICVRYTKWTGILPTKPCSPLASN
jgi:hypothetical protein